MINIIVKENVFEMKTTTLEAPFVKGQTAEQYLEDAAPQIYKVIDFEKEELQTGVVKFVLNLRPIEPLKLTSTVLVDGDTLQIILIPKISVAVATAILAAISVTLAESTLAVVVTMVVLNAVLFAGLAFLQYALMWEGSISPINCSP